MKARPEKPLLRIVAAVACACLMLAAGIPARAEKPLPTVRPMTLRYDHTLPSTVMTVENIEQYFNIELKQDYSRGHKLTVLYSISPVSPLFASYDGSTLGLYIKLHMSVFLTEGDTEPYMEKNYTFVLNRASGFTRSGSIDFLPPLDQENVRLTYEVIGCNGKLGPDPFETDTP